MSLAPAHSPRTPPNPSWRSSLLRRQRHCPECLFMMPCVFFIFLPLPMKWSEVNSLSHVRLFVTPWTVAYQAPPSLGFSRQESWSGVPLPSPFESMDENILRFKDNLCFTSIFMKFGKKSSEEKEKLEEKKKKKEKRDLGKEERKSGRKAGEMEGQTTLIGPVCECGLPLNVLTCRLLCCLSTCAMSIPFFKTH